jgi:hypothetical protein
VPDSPNDRESAHSAQSRGRQHPQLIPLSAAEIRRLLSLPRHDDRALSHGLRWSAWRRAHQAEARRHHFRRRLRLQVMQI